MTPPLNVLEAYRRGAIAQNGMILLALQSVSEENAGEFLEALTGALSNSVRRFVDEMPFDDDEVAWNDVRILLVGMFDRDLGDIEATHRQRLRRGVRILRARYARVYRPDT